MALRSSCFLLLVVFAPLATAQDETYGSPASAYQVLYAFAGGPDGGGVWGSVAFDQAGNLYGATSGGGLHGDGTVFRLAPQQGGSWEESVLYNFCSAPLCDDGALPFAGPTIDASGNVYGTTQSGGEYSSGVVYELAPSTSGWNFAVLYNFCAKSNCSDGGSPWSSPIVDESSGNLYGSAFVSYELSPGDDGWIESVLHTFTGQNGFFPQAAPIMDQAGSLYGTTRDGGGSSECMADDGCGTVYELQPVLPSIGGGWKEQILHAFGSFKGDGITPGLGQLAMDSSGNFYGTTQSGGLYGYGTVFKLTKGTWIETILYNFIGSSYGPGGGVTFGRSGNLYGTTIYGGGIGCGAIYKLAPVSPTAAGSWQYTVLHYFDGSDGCQPDANLTLGPDGNLYGTTATGGPGGAGVVFEITP